MLSGEQLLEQAAKDGAMPSEGWPRALGVVLSRLEHIVKDEFPTPTLPPSTSAERERSATPSKPPPTEGAAAGTVPSSQETTSADKENAPPPSSSGITATTKDDKINNNPSPGPSTRALSTDPVASTDAPTTTEDPVTASSLPPELHSLYTSITSVLRKQFATDPPHTIQRLAELVLCPRAHYRFLPPYLRALDRVVSVSSATSIFPLPQAVLPASTGILNGITPTTSTTASSTSSSERGLGSDESLGGALLTPIPWLQNNNSREQRSASANGNNSELVSESTEMVDGPNGTGRIETVDVGVDTDYNCG
ncbi:Protein phosphatase 4 core regulatory subunit R2 [Macrophomina phaseolina MS6]|uniref:Protein phosphatase 4 core regulatory subunit R2 n=1 Tax=Macrophomina phaseolina (strain MS6) TaxID=1126212 RepID=K2RTR4_MACPH|nr:Protein phosphatase 4 core regulatory subunit R2 [Macrophomina phaseolina MS6]